MLALAAQEADIVGIIAQSAKGGGMDFGSDTDAMVGEKVSWMREAAGERFGGGNPRHRRPHLPRIARIVRTDQRVTNIRVRAPNQVPASCATTGANVATSPGKMAR
jgi:hypothetical protein